MAKIRHNNAIDTFVDIFTSAKNSGSLHLYAEDETINGRKLTINGSETLHFGTCGYLGLDQHPKLKHEAIEATKKYGIQFPMSKTYVSSPLYKELEDLLEKMFEAPVAISKNCTLSHLATIPSLVRPGDLIILDHQVHASVQDVTKKMLSQGVNVEMIRHSNMEMLEETVKKLRNNHDKIWYMADGVYSMYGDFAPIKDMIRLAEKYEQLYLYVDDAHGMSWAGKNGTGYVMSQMKKLHHKMILTATMGKGFGTCGGVTVFPDKIWQHKVKIFGGPLTFSVQMEPPILGAAIASARLHLSDEIYEYQKDLRSKIQYCNELIEKTDLPLITVNSSPIFFIGMGTMAMGNDFILRLIKMGIYVNLAPFPVVPAKNIGARITISRHNTFEDIESMVNKLQIAFHESLEEVGQTQEKIAKAFKLKSKQLIEPKVENIELVLTCLTSITEIDKEIWNKHLGHRGMFDWDGIRVLERAFTNNELKENNWDFRYYIIRSDSGEILLMTFFIIALYKEDMFSRASISIAMEQKRVKDPYYFTSRAIIMGSLITEGDHIYVNKKERHWKHAMVTLFDELSKEQERQKASNIIIRDLDMQNDEMHKFMLEQSFVKVDMPVACVVNNLSWQNEDEFINGLSKKNRRNFKLEIKNFEHFFDVEIRDSLSDDELEYAVNLFKEVKNKNFGLNTFHFPYKLFLEMNNSSSFEFLVLKLKKEYSNHLKPVAVGFCHYNFQGTYNPSIVGLDYEYVYEYGVYRQILYQVVKRAHSLGCHTINMGLSAAIEKKKVGATLYPKVAYVQAVDNYEQEMMEATTLIEKD